MGLVHLDGAVLPELSGHAVRRRADRQGDDVAERAGERQRLQRRRDELAAVVLDEHETRSSRSPATQAVLADRSLALTRSHL